MIKHILWSPRAEQEFASILEYLQENWDTKITLKFINDVDHSLEIILRFPEIFPFSGNKKKVRKCVLNKHTCLYYRIRNATLEIVALFDSRQNPAKLKL